MVRGRGGGVCGEVAEDGLGGCGAEGAEGGGDGGRGVLLCLRTCETVFECSLCLATLIDAS